MNLEEFRALCICKPNATECFPFDSETLAFKVFGKIFALTDIDVFESVNLKCDPVRAIELREIHQAVIPGYHMNKKHWNTILMNMDIDDKALKDLIDHSYELVLSKVPKKVRNECKVG